MTYENRKNFHIQKIMAWILAVLIVFGALSFPHSSEAAADYTSIRVKLNLSKTSLSVAVTGSYQLKEDPSLTLASGQTYTVSISNGKILLQGGGISTTLSSVTFVRGSSEANTQNLLTINNIGYLGDICFTAVSGKVQAVNTLDFEHYLYGVVAAEMGGSFPLEALKAQTLCARCYAIRKISAASSSATYDIVGSASDQAYAGYVKNGSVVSSKVIQAVDATKGEVLTYNGKVIEAFFSASNGGQTEYTGTTWSGGANKDAQYPYLIQVEDPYDIAACAGKSSYEQIIFVPADPTDSVTSSNTYSNKVLDDMQERVYSALQAKYNLTAATDVTLVKINSFENGKKRWSSYATSRSYVTAEANLTVSLPGGVSETLTVTIQLMNPSGSSYSLSHDYLNGNFRLRYVEATANGWNLVNRRYGHGVGMSQMGAKYMAESKGMTYTQIVDFYYPGTKRTTFATGGWKGTAVTPVTGITFDGSFATGINPGTDAAALLRTLGSGYTLYSASSAGKTSGDVVTGDLMKDSSGKTYTVVIYGDLNSDGQITLNDLLRQQKYLLGIISLDGAALKAADVNKDGAANLSDLLRIQKHLLGVTGITQ